MPQARHSKRQTAGKRSKWLSDFTAESTKRDAKKLKDKIKADKLHRKACDVDSQADFPVVEESGVMFKDPVSAGGDHDQHQKPTADDEDTVGVPAASNTSALEGPVCASGDRVDLPAASINQHEGPIRDDDDAVGVHAASDTDKLEDAVCAGGDQVALSA